MTSVSYVSKVLTRRRLTGEIAARPQRCHVPPKLADHHDVVRERVKQKPDATIAERRTWLRETHKISVSTGVMHMTLIQLKLTLKKTLHAAEQNRADVATARLEWRNEQPN